MAFHVKNFYFWQSNTNQFKLNSVILVTGAGSGIGEAVAYQYATRKCKLILADINQEALLTVQNKCKQIMADHNNITNSETNKYAPYNDNNSNNSSSSNSSQDILTIQLDVTSFSACEAMINTIINTFHRLDIMVLCAGLGAHHVFAQTPDLSIFHKLMNVNFYGYLHCITAAYKHLIASSGQVIAITSFSGEVGLPYRTSYCASKFAITGFLEALRSEMNVLHKEGKLAQPFDITIVCPPTVNTNLRKNSLTNDPSLKESAPVKALSVEECAAAVVDAGDRKLRKAFFPLKSWAASYLRPLVPDFVDSFVVKRAKL
jgi:short-subunit dehydrogenase